MLTREEVKELEMVYIKRVPKTTPYWGENGEMDFLDGSTIKVNAIALNKKDIFVKGRWVGYDCLFRDEDHYLLSEMNKLPSLEEELQNTVTTGVDKLEAGKSYRCIDKIGFLATNYISDYDKWFTDDIVTVEEVNEYGTGIRGCDYIIAKTEYQFFEEVAADESIDTPVQGLVKDNKPVKSDGGKSSYYEIILPEWLLQKQAEQGFIMIEDLAEVLYNNEFNYTNVLKTQKRMYELEQGKGKEGNSIEYDANKGKYSIDKQVERFNRSK